MAMLTVRTTPSMWQTNIFMGLVIMNLELRKELKPTCDPNGVYSVKRTCAELGISHKTLRKYRERGYIRPINPDNVCRPKYLGQSIIDCWNILIAL